MTFRRYAPLLAFLLSCTSSDVQAQETAKETVDVPGYYELTPRIGTGGQPTESGFRTLADRGYKAVINLRTGKEAVDLDAEERTVKGLGLEYYNVPFDGREPRDEPADAFLGLMEKLTGERIFVHCAAGSRVGGLMLIYRVLKNGIGQSEAEEEARKIGLRSEILLKFARDFVSRRQSQ